MTPPTAIPLQVLWAAAVAAWLLAGMPDATAAGLRISPVRLDLSRTQPTAQVELSNLTGTPVAVQIKAFAWRQEDGEDFYEPTKDLFFAPPIVTVPALGRTAVRFRLRASVPPKVEGSYRVYFQELPPAGAADQAGAGMSFRIRFGVPVFVLPEASSAPALTVQARRDGPMVAVDLSNTGSMHLKVDGVDLFPAGVDRQDPGQPLAAAGQNTRGAGYLLPGSRGQWQLAIPDAAPDGPLLLRVRTDDFAGRAGSGILKNGWRWQPVAGPGPAAPQQP